MATARTCLALLALAAAARGAPVRDGPVAADLIADVAAISPGVPFTVAVRLRIDSPWHIYWTNPGDSGMAPSFEWDLPDGFSAGEWSVPSPIAISTPPFMTYGHEAEALYLATVTPPTDLPEAPVTLKLTADWLVCHEMCIPGQAEIELTLPVGPAEPQPEHAAAIADARDDLPAAPEGWSLRFGPSGEAYRLTAAPPPSFAGPVESARFFPRATRLIRHAAPQEFRAAPDGFTLDLVPAPGTAPPARVAGVLVVETPGGTAAFEVDLTFNGEAYPSPANPERKPTP